LSERFHRKRGIAKSIRRIAIAEIDAALAAIREGSGDDAEAIHAVRQQLKRLRALIRLPHRQFPAYRDENTAFRDLGRKLAHTRDADVLGDTFDGVAEAASLPDAAGIRRRLRDAAADQAGPSDRRELLDGEITAGLLEARRRAAQWQFEGKGLALLGGGLRQVYKAMRADEAIAAQAPNAANFHEWRKQTKYHAAQLALLRAVAPKIFKGYRKIADKLGSTLGDHHDLDVLVTAVNRLDDLAEQDRGRLIEAIRHRNAELEGKAFRLGDELTAERPDDFLRRIEAGWKSWRK
jgi:CHAD domain-containing protein